MLVQASRYPEVNETVAAGDYKIPPEVYWRLGQAALDAIRLCLAAAQIERPSNVLDLPSGYGTVLRYMSAEWPEAELTACDIDPGAVDFCAETFGATALYGREHPGELEADTYDLIWVGSLLSHLDAPMWHEFFDFFESALRPGGLLIVTTQGREIARRLTDPRHQDIYMPSADARERILAGYEQEGFGFAEYPTSPEQRAKRSEPSSYGIAVAKPSWQWSFYEQRDLLTVAYMEDRWGSQDVVGLMKATPGSHPLRIPLG